MDLDELHEAARELEELRREREGGRAGRGALAPAEDVRVHLHDELLVDEVALAALHGRLEHGQHELAQQRLLRAVALVRAERGKLGEHGPPLGDAPVARDGRVDAPRLRERAHGHEREHRRQRKQALRPSVALRKVVSKAFEKLRHQEDLVV